MSLPALQNKTRSWS